MFGGMDYVSTHASGDMMAKVVYLPDSKMRPMFGMADPKTGTVYVNSDLPLPVRSFVKEHELFHLRDKARFWILRELKANMHAGIKRPFGFMLCVFMSMRPYRLKFYLKRLIVGR